MKEKIFQQLKQEYFPHTTKQQHHLMKSYTLKQLSLMYFPFSTVKSAGTQLKRWINRNRALRDALEDAGYRDGQRLLTPRQVGIVFRHLGEP